MQRGSSTTRTSRALKGSMIGEITSRVLKWLVKILELNQLLLGPARRALAEMLGSQA